MKAIHDTKNRHRMIWNYSCLNQLKCIQNHGVRELLSFTHNFQLIDRCKDKIQRFSVIDIMNTL